jgi:L-aspartate oxidase
VHGANRLASTSLLEGLVWGYRAAQDIRSKRDTNPVHENQIPQWDDSGLLYDADMTLIQGDMQTIRNLMWHYVGLVRSDYRLNRAVRELRTLWLDIEEFYRKTRLNDSLIGLRNSVQAALFIAQAAQRNRITRGSHYREDKHPLDNARPPEDQLVKLSGGVY